MGFLKFVPMIFMNYEINKIDLGASFSEFSKSNGKNLDHQVKMCSAKKLSEGKTDFTGINFCYKFKKENILSHAACT